MTPPEHILLIDKPKGITSFDVIRRLRRARGIIKMGHAGTLDPLATGLMILGVGPGTKLLSDFIKLSKEYVANVLVGERRSTGDMEGIVLEEKEVTSLDRRVVEEVLTSMIGTLELPVSAYSAIKKDGVPMYKRARRAEKTGEVVTDVPIRNMEITHAQLEALTCEGGRCTLTIRFSVGSGTYIRSLAEELGRRLGYPATLSDLRRTKVGDFRVEDAEHLKDSSSNLTNTY
jgi:tRNA pseudouridine55 synthase